MPKSKTICSAPFNQVCVTATGRYALCCNAVANYSFPCEERHINQMKNVNDWFEGTYMKNIRKAMIKGKKLKVLVEKKGRYLNQYVGRSEYNQSVFMKSSKNIIGSVVNTKIIGNTNFALSAELA